MWIFFLTVLLFFCIRHYFHHNSKNGKIFNKIPGPKGYPIIGNVFDFFYGPVPIFYQMRKFANRFDSLYKIWIFTNRIVTLYNPADIEIILSSQKHIEKSPLYLFLDPWLKNGLLTSTGGLWQRRRKILTPAFHVNILRQFCKIFDEQSVQLVKAIKLGDIGHTIDVVPHVTQFSLYTICETAMGTKLSANTSTINKYKQAIHDIGELLVYRLVRPWLHDAWLFNFLSSGKKQTKALNVLHDFTSNIITARRKSKAFAELSKILNTTSDEDTKTDLKKATMLDLLLLAELHGNIDTPGVMEEVDTFMFEGHDTTSMAITFCLMALANNKHVQEKVINELNEIFGESDRPATTLELNQMQYLERCIKEALRLYPSVSFIARYLREDLQLSEYLVPADTMVHIHIFDLHRCPKLYEAPDIFDPDRFLPENVAKRHQFAYVPFSAGPRNCIGQKFAMLEEKSVISRILRNFILEPVTKPEDIVFTADLVLRSINPIYVKFTPRIRQEKKLATQ